MTFKEYKTTTNYLSHHGIDGQQWGVRNGPPYPLTRQAKRDTKRYIRDVREKQAIEERRNNKYIGQFASSAATSVGLDVAKGIKRKKDAQILASSNPGTAIVPAGLKEVKSYKGVAKDVGMMAGKAAISGGISASMKKLSDDKKYKEINDRITLYKAKYGNYKISDLEESVHMKRKRGK